MAIEGDRKIRSSITSSLAGEYLMEVSIRSPPLTFMAIADTGSDLTWTQCLPCPGCYKQDTPLFDPKKSSSYKTLPCNSTLCSETGKPGCDDQNTCTYEYSYGDGSFTVGDLSSETFTFATNDNKNASIPSVVFGCGHHNAGTFNKTGSGLVGLGGGKLSVVNQFGEVINGKFSYCLIPFGISDNATSKISFGESAILSGGNTKTTPLFKRTPETFYYLKLEALSVIVEGKNGTRYAKKIINSDPGSTGKSASASSGNIIIDSGTTLTFLPRQLATDLENTLRETISGTPVPDPSGLFSLCYKTGQGTVFPTVVAHFTGAHILLSNRQTFLQISDDLICLTLLGNDDIPIFGNLSQTDYLIGYDLVNGTVSFQRIDCTKVV